MVIDTTGEGKDEVSYILGGSNGFVYQWCNVAERSGRKCHSAVKAHRAPVMSLSCVGDGTTIVSASRRGKIKIWRTNSLELVSEIDSSALFASSMESNIFCSVEMGFGEGKEKTLSKYDLRALSAPPAKSVAKASASIVVQAMRASSRQVEDGFELYLGTSGSSGPALVKASICGLKAGPVSQASPVEPRFFA